MSPSSPQDDQTLLREELVAYLDGELAPQQCDQIEQRLAKDESYLKEMQGLDAAWHALDELPSATVDQSFTRTTIAMVATQAQQDVTQQTALLPRMRRRRKGLIALACCTALVVGFIATRWLDPDRNGMLVADLPIIQLVDVYSQVSDVDFLQSLGHALGQERLSAIEKSIDPTEIDQLHDMQKESPTDRQQRIANMAPEDLAELLAKQKEFSGQMTDTQRQRMRELHAAIQDSQQSAELQTLLLAYRNWLRRRTPGELAELRQQPTAGRLKLIQQFSRKDLRTLSHEELAAVRKEVLAFHEENREKIVERMRQHRRGRAEHFFRQRPNAVAPIVAGIVLHSRGQEELLQSLTSVLSDDTQQRLQKMRKEQKVRLMVDWIRQAFPNEITPADLEAFFVSELSNDEREKLLALPWQEMEAELIRRFQREMMGGPQGSAPWDFLGNRRRNDFRNPANRARERQSRGPYGPEGRLRRGPPRSDSPEGRPPGRRERRHPPPEPGEGPPPPPSGQPI